MKRNDLRVLTVTSLFPNNVNHNLGGFIARRMVTWAEAYASKWAIIAPVPYFPSLPFKSAWKKYSDVNRAGRFKKWEIHHFRYAMIPQFGLPFQGYSMAFCTMKQVISLNSSIGPFDLIDSHFIYPDGFAAMKISQKLKIPLVVSARGTDINWYSQMVNIRPMIQEVLKTADAVIGVSEDLVEKMIGLGAPRDRCYHIPNGVDTERFFPSTGKGSPKNDRLLAVGNLVSEKGFHNLLKAIAALRPFYPEIELDIIGSGPQMDNLTSLSNALHINDRVKFIGQVSHDDIGEWFRKSGMFCLSSLREGNPNVVMEALASGLPVAATPAGGVPELIDENLNGAVARDFSVNALVETIQKVLDRKWSPFKIQKTIANRTWKTVAGEVNTVFHNVCKLENDLV